MPTTTTTSYPMPTTPVTPEEGIPSLKANALSYFEALMETATGDKSVYRTAIDKIEEISLDSAFSADGDTYTEGTALSSTKFSDSEKAKMIAELAAAVVPSITNQAMQLGLTMAKEDRDAQYQYPIMITEAQAKNAQANKTDKDADMIEANVFKSYHESLLIQGTLVQDYGMTTTPWAVPTVATKVITLGDKGSKFYSAQSTAAQGYYTYARSLRENGEVDVTIGVSVDSDGKQQSGSAYLPAYSGYTSVTDTTSISETMKAGLTANQTRVQWRTYGGFADNMLQHGVNASSNMVATMVTEDLSAPETKAALGQWKCGMGLLGVPTTCTL